jgi:2,4-dienoyl-CoA reductase (NADPH2)
MTTLTRLLFDPVRIGPMTVPNRLVMPAMHLNFTMDGAISERFVRFYRARAEGGVGLVIIGGCAIDQAGGGFFLVGLHDDRFLPGLRQFTAALHDGLETKVCAQLYHAGRYAFSWYTQQQPLAPSPLGSRYNPETPREMSLADIEAVQSAFVAAARRAAEAGFDAVEILGSAGYLIAEFLSPAANQRTDGYGGSLEARARFGVEVIRRVKEAVGDRLAVLIRVAGSDFVPGGHTNAEAMAAARLFEAAGADAINVTGGWHESRVPQITMGVPEGAYRYLAAGIKRAVSVPVIVSNRLGDPRKAAQVLANGEADLVAVGRPLIADPDLPRKVARGDDAAVRPCVACNQGCFDNVFAGAPIRCLLNPQAGFEAERAIEPLPADAAPGLRKKVVVVGAGPAGVEAAVVAAERGHQVVLFERKAQVGGALGLAGAPPGRHDFERYVTFLDGELRRRGVTVHLRTDADVGVVRREAPDHVIVATGAAPVVPPFAVDAKHPNVVLAEAILQDEVVLRGDVVVVGGGSVGAETALAVAARDVIEPEVAAFLLVNDAESPERVKELLTKPRRAIHVCDVLPSIGKDLGKTTRWTILQELQRAGVQLHTGVKVEALTADGVVLQSADGARHTLPCGTVVLATGYKPRAALAADLTDAGFRVELVGDAKSPRNVMEAVHEGFLAARAVG